MIAANASWKSTVTRRTLVWTVGHLIRCTQPIACRSAGRSLIIIIAFVIEPVPLAPRQLVKAFHSDLCLAFHVRDSHNLTIEQHVSGWRLTRLRQQFPVLPSIHHGSS